MDMKHTVQTTPYMYVALGDSLANGVGANGCGYVQQLNALLSKDRKVELLVVAKNGQTSGQLLKRLSKSLDVLKRADLITWNIGGNDLRLAWKLYGAKPIPTSLQRKKLEVTLSTWQSR